ncbi:MAG: TRAP transporter permease [Alphaproteobacteria bacterium]|nr:TRAP transporter permease [Alphaproteobacteria bacterium]
MNFRWISEPAASIVKLLLIGLAIYHYYTAGWGILPEHWHNSIHLSSVMALIFLVFGHSKAFHQRGAGAYQPRWWMPGNVPLFDYVLCILAAIVALYIPWTLNDLTFRIGDPNNLDVVMGTILIVLVLEATRRCMGPALPAIVCVFIAYALWGNYVPGVLTHPGAGWHNFVSHIYMTQEGIFGIPVKVVASFVFHFVLFGVVATRMGLGQFFIDLATVAAGRYPGGPAKVAVISSALFGTISGSSIANAVTTGSLTIPAMKRIGYRGSFAAAVEAAASAGGQITPPIMGAAAFIMVEFLNVSYATIIMAAAIPASMHYIGVLTMVHLEAKRLGLRGLTEEEMPRLLKIVREGWHTLIPLVILITIIMKGYTPYLAAFYGITTCLVIGFIQPRNRLTIPDVLEAFATGTKYALAVGAAAASVGIVVGTITLTGAGFRVSFIVTQAAAQTAENILPLFQLLPVTLFTAQDLQLFFTLVFVALTCIAMGCGIPTTALYIVLASIAAPAMKMLGVPDLAAHLFIFYYGILADLTPPVCTTAYAAAGIAGANPFTTGLTAFRLGLAKATVPFVFVYSPSMLLMIEGHFSWGEFLLTTSTCVVGVVTLGTAMVGFAFTRIGMANRFVLTFAALLMIAPNVKATALGLVLLLPVIGFNWVKSRREQLAVAAPAASVGS